MMNGQNRRLFVLRWNPKISSFEEKEFLRGIQLLNRPNSTGLGLNWSVWEWEKVSEGDWFVWVKVGEGQPNGLVGMGFFYGKPFEDKEKSCREDGTRIHFVNISLELQLIPENLHGFLAEDMDKAVPGLDIAHGHAGMEIPQPQAELLIRYLVKALALQRDYHNENFALEKKLNYITPFLRRLLIDYCPELMKKVRKRQYDAGYPHWFREALNELPQLNVEQIRQGIPLEDCFLDEPNWQNDVLCSNLVKNETLPL